MRKIAIIVFMALMSAAGPAAFGQTAYQGGLTVSSLKNATATGAGTAFAIPPRQGLVPSSFTWTVTFKTAAPGAQTTNLEGSIDNVNWFTLDSSTVTTYVSDTNSGEMRHVVNKSVGFIRCNLATYTQGSNAGVTCNFLVSAR